MGLFRSRSDLVPYLPGWPLPNSSHPLPFLVMTDNHFSAYQLTSSGRNLNVDAYKLSLAKGASSYHVSRRLAVPENYTTQPQQALN